MQVFLYSELTQVCGLKPMLETLWVRLKEEVARSNCFKWTELIYMMVLKTEAVSSCFLVCCKYEKVGCAALFGPKEACEQRKLG